MKSKDFLKEIRELSEEGRIARIDSLTEELMKLRFRKAAGQLEQSHRINEVKGMLSRALTVDREARRAVEKN